MSNPIIVLTGPSGAGKTTLCNYLVRKHGFVKPKTFTTRPKRSEEDEEAYVFVNESEFRKKLDNNEILEHVEAFGNYYGSPTEPFKNGHKIAIPLTYKGAKFVRNHYPGAKVIKLNITKDTLLQRVKTRSFIEEKELAMRLQELEQIDHEAEHDYVLDSDRPIQETEAEIDKIIEQVSQPVRKVA